VCCVSATPGQLIIDRTPNPQYNEYTLHTYIVTHTERTHTHMDTATLDKIIADPATRRLLKYYAPTLQDSYGGACQSVYRQLNRRTGNDYLSRVLSGLNSKLTDSRKRADQMGFGFNITLSHLVELWIQQQGRCTVTGVVLSFETGSLQHKNPRAVSCDRIVNSRGYVRGNVRLLTHWANNAKSTWAETVFETMIEEIANTKRNQMPRCSGLRFSHYNTVYPNTPLQGSPILSYTHNKNTGNTTEDHCVWGNLRL